MTNHFNGKLKSKNGTVIPVVVRLKKMVIMDDIYIISFLTDKKRFNQS